jgi:hypothetical protein
MTAARGAAYSWSMKLAAEFGVDHHVVGKTVWLAFRRPAAP